MRASRPLVYRPKKHSIVGTKPHRLFVERAARLPPSSSSPPHPSYPRCVSRATISSYVPPPPPNSLFALLPTRIHPRSLSSSRFVDHLSRPRFETISASFGRPVIGKSYRERKREREREEKNLTAPNDNSDRSRY